MKDKRVKHNFDFEYIEECLDRGMTYQSIADNYGCSRAVVWKWYRSRKRKDTLSRKGVDAILQENKRLKRIINKVEKALEE